MLFAQEEELSGFSIRRNIDGNDKPEFAFNNVVLQPGATLKVQVLSLLYTVAFLGFCKGRGANFLNMRLTFFESYKKSVSQLPTQITHTVISRKITSQRGGRSPKLFEKSKRGKGHRPILPAVNTLLVIFDFDEIYVDAIIYA